MPGQATREHQRVRLDLPNLPPTLVTVAGTGALPHAGPLRPSPFGRRRDAKRESTGRKVGRQEGTAPQAGRRSESDATMAPQAWMASIDRPDPLSGKVGKAGGNK